MLPNRIRLVISLILNRYIISAPIENKIIYIKAPKNNNTNAFRGPFVKYMIVKFDMFHIRNSDKNIPNIPKNTKKTDFFTKNNPF